MLKHVFNIFCVNNESLSSVYVLVFCPPAVSVAQWTYLYVQGDMERSFRTADDLCASK